MLHANWPLGSFFAKGDNSTSSLILQIALIPTISLSGRYLYLYLRALAIREKVLGTDLPLTIDTRERLIALLRSMGSTEEAAQLERAQPRATDLPREETLVSSMRKAMEQSAAMAGTWSSVLPACPQCQLS